MEDPDSHQAFFGCTEQIALSTTRVQNLVFGLYVTVAVLGRFARVRYGESRKIFWQSKPIGRTHSPRVTRSIHNVWTVSPNQHPENEKNEPPRVSEKFKNSESNHKNSRCVIFYQKEIVRRGTLLVGGKQAPTRNSSER